MNNILIFFFVAILGNAQNALSDCLKEHTLMSLESKVNFIYQASEIITLNTNYYVSSTNQSIEFKSGNQIVFKPNTHIDIGSNVIAKISPCEDCKLTFTYPKFFSPNGDGFNDYWMVNWEDRDSFLELQIFDRFGKLLRRFTSPFEAWDGVFNANSMMATDYWFLLLYTDCSGKTKEFKSHFSLIR